MSTTQEQSTPVNRDNIFQIADQLHAQGITPSVKRMRAELKRGSHSTINKYMREWRETRFSDEHVHASPPDAEPNAKEPDHHRKSSTPAFLRPIPRPAGRDETETPPDKLDREDSEWLMGLIHTATEQCLQQHKIEDGIDQRLRSLEGAVHALEKAHKPERELVAYVEALRTDVHALHDEVQSFKQLIKAMMRVAGNA